MTVRATLQVVSGDMPLRLSMSRLVHHGPHTDDQHSGQIMVPDLAEAEREVARFATPGEQVDRIGDGWTWAGK